MATPRVFISSTFYDLNEIRETIENAGDWKEDYRYDNHTNEFYHKSFAGKEDQKIKDWFKLS